MAEVQSTNSSCKAEHRAKAKSRQNNKSFKATSTCPTIQTPVSQPSPAKGSGRRLHVSASVFQGSASPIISKVYSQALVSTIVECASSTWSVDSRIVSLATRTSTDKALTLWVTVMPIWCLVEHVPIVSGPATADRSRFGASRFKLVAPVIVVWIKTTATAAVASCALINAARSVVKGAPVIAWIIVDCLRPWRPPPFAIAVVAGGACVCIETCTLITLYAGVIIGGRLVGSATIS